MPELLFELGCEELPATSVRRAYTDLLDSLTAAFREACIFGSAGTAMGTPRRLIVSFPELPARQPDATKERRGPALKSAYDPSGNPTPALLGFCRSQGVDVAQLRRDDQYVWVTKAIPGRRTVELLAEILPKAVRGLSFDKTMRWGAGRMRFARPIRWILAAFEGDPVHFEIEGVTSGVHSRGHRFYAPEPFEARTAASLIDGLRARCVEPDAARRKALVLEQAAAVADGTPILPEDLVDENVFLTEWPTAIGGMFDPRFVTLPEAVLEIAMAKHERMFPVRDGAGALTNRFVFIRNSGEDDFVRAGCAWVLNARFNDAKFFYDQDSRRTMEDFLGRTSTIVFQDQLGSVFTRSERLSTLTAKIAALTGADEDEIEFARTAGRFAKADLSTGLVGELPALQGTIGGDYLRREGRPEPVAWAVATQYDLGKNPNPVDPGGRTAVRLIIADQLDKLAGYLGLGLVPSGSSDPYALRRAVTLLIEAAWRWPAPLPSYAELFELALAGYRETAVVLDESIARTALFGLFASRYATLLPDARYDILEAAIGDPDSPSPTWPQAVRFRTRVLGRVAGDTAFVQTATRPLNIVQTARRKAIPVGEGLSDLDRDKLDSAEGLSLLDRLTANESPLASAARAEVVEGVVACLQALIEPITRFFDSTMVMVDDPDVRFARLTLLEACCRQLLVAGDFSKIVM